VQQRRIDRRALVRSDLQRPVDKQLHVQHRKRRLSCDRLPAW
jgi:hypothetical protein